MGRLSCGYATIAPLVARRHSEEAMLAWWEALGSKEQAGGLSAPFCGLFWFGWGVLLPLPKNLFEERISDRRLRHERELLRQQKVIDAQSLMLDELANIFWTWRYLAMRVAYYGCYVREDEYKAAAVAYKSEIWGVLSKLRFSTSRMGRLFSETSFEQLRAFFLGGVSIFDQI